MVEQTANAADAIVPSGPAIAILEREAPPSVFVTDLMMPNIGALLPPERHGIAPSPQHKRGTPQAPRER